jgi:hypothetical protein
VRDGTMRITLAREQALPRLEWRVRGTGGY